jgi:glycosyltransferase involved in cell wall biosynthesis
VLEEGPLVDGLRAAGSAPVVWPEINAAIGGGLAAGRYGPSRALDLYRAAKVFRSLLVELVAKTSATSVLFNSSRATLLGASGGLPQSCSRVVMVRDSPSPPYLSFLRSVVAKSAIARASTAIIANSAWTARQIGGGREIGVVAPFIDERFFTEPNAPVRPSGQKFRILLLGRIAPWKGQLMGLAALSSIDLGGVGAITVAGGPWFGEQEYFERVRACAGTIADGDLVHVVGHVDDVLALIDRHDIVVHTSQVPEPFGQVVVQAMARGRLCVAANDGGPREIITHLHDGLLYRMNDPRDLADCLKRAMSPDFPLRQMGQEAASSARRYRPAVTELRLRAALAQAESGLPLASSGAR